MRFDQGDLHPHAPVLESQSTNLHRLYNIQVIGLLGCTPKCRLSQVIKSRKSEVDPQGIDEEKLFEVMKRFVTKIKVVKGVHK